MSNLSYLSTTLDILFLAKTALALLIALLIPSILGRVIGQVTLYLNTRHLAGPPYIGFVSGNFQQVLDDEKAIAVNVWMEKYGKVFRGWGLLGVANVYMADLKGLSHILKHDSVLYQKPDYLRYLLSRVTGQGLVAVDGDVHRGQRKVMNPAFGSAEIRALTDTFLDKSVERFQLRDALSVLIQNGADEIDILHWLSRMTLDVIGLAGFNYQLNTIPGKYNVLNDAFSRIFATDNFLTFPVVLRLMFPRLRALPEPDSAFRRARATSSRIAKELYERSKAAAEKTGASQDRDLFSCLVKSNMNTEASEAQRMKEDEVLAQVPTFLSAGHETTSTSTTLALFLLCTRLETQSRLRAELLSVPTEAPSMDQLNALPYLDAVVRETLRVLAPIPSTVRVAMTDDVIPLSQPFVDRYGREHDVLAVKKGQTFVLPLLAINKDKKVWGEDAEEFRPERWSNLPEAVKSVPGVWSNMMTFLGGPRGCIGWRFAVIETKALLFTLIRAFEFELTVPKEDVLIKRGFAVHRPEIRGKKGNQLPLRIRPVKV
ncbi:hypothetical protein V5O48_008737 [Marasmius crinis-equi]|uniref:Cytochrome P450 n=1 Tax=Marasmius crinis-equi TaxID=585013 RepID=A0ABR3FD21_9AGAR